MKAYNDVIKYILDHGYMTEPTRTGSRTMIVHPMQMSHDLANGFPILTTRKINFHAIAVEMDGYLKGITDKKWYQDNGCSFWNEWCNRNVLNIRMGQMELKDKSDEEIDKIRKETQIDERDIFSGYGWEWLHWGQTYTGYTHQHEQYDVLMNNYAGKGINQIQKAVDTLKKAPLDRRALVIAHDPKNEAAYAIPPCMYTFQFYSHDAKRLNMVYTMRSNDMALGGANDFPSNALLLTLVARALEMEPGMLTASISIPHIYEAHIGKLREQMQRTEFPLPTLELDEGIDCFNFDYQRARLLNYQHHKHISFDRSV